MPTEKPTTVDPTYRGEPLIREDALCLCEQRTHIQGFRRGHEAAVSQLFEAAAHAFTSGHDEAADALRKVARDLKTLEDDAVSREYGDELDGVDVDAIRAWLLDEEVSR
jgi:hypothetical protein